MELSDTATLTDLRKQFKRRVRQYAATTSSAIEEETSPLFSDNAIADAINKARRMLARILPSAKKWCVREAVLLTAEDIQEYGLDYEVMEIIAVQWDVTSDGKRNENTVDADDVKTRAMEEACIVDPFNTPSITNPKYRIANKGIRLIVSTDGTVTKDKYVRVEYIGEPNTLVAGSYSGWPNTLNDVCIDIGIKILAAEDLPQVAAVASESAKSILLSERV